MENLNEYKNQIFERYNYLSENSKTRKDLKEKESLFEILVRNYWLQEYFKKYRNEFGL